MRKGIIFFIFLSLFLSLLTPFFFVQAQTTSTTPFFQWKNNLTWSTFLYGREGSQQSPFDPSVVFNEIKGVALDAVSSAAEGLLYIVTFIASIVFWLGAQLISFFFSLNNQVLDIPMVTIGWGIVRDIANLGFVLAIIVIALATIVRFKEYGAKKILPKLIAAAILVNFSLTLGGIVLNFSNTITGFFLEKSSSSSMTSGGLFHVADQLATAFSPQKLAVIATSTTLNIHQSQPSTSTKTLISLAGLFFAAAFTLLSALTLLGIALMLLTRFIWLIILLVLSPIAWFFWVIPDLSGEFKKWWTSFFKWCFYAPTLSFFLYLTIYSVDKLKDLNVSYQQAAMVAYNGVDPTATANLPILNGFQQISNMIVIIGLLVGGLMVAQSMSGTGADQMMKLASKAGKGAGKWAGGKVTQTGKNVGRRALAGGVDESGKTRLERVGAKLGKVPFVGRAFTGISAASSKAKDSMKKEVEDKEKKYDVRTVDDLNAIAKRKTNNTPQDDVALMKSIAKKGGWSKLDKSVQDRLKSSARRLGAGDQITPLIPQLAGEFATFSKEDDTEEKREAKRRSAEAKAASKLTEVPKSTDKDFVAFAERNAQHFSSGMIDQFGTYTGENADDIRSHIKSGLNEHTKDLEVKIKDEKGNEIMKDMTPKNGYQGIKVVREKLKEHTSKIEGDDADIESLTSQIEELEDAIKEKKGGIEKLDTEIKKLQEESEKAEGFVKTTIEKEILEKTNTRKNLELDQHELEEGRSGYKGNLNTKYADRNKLKHEKRYMQKALDSTINELPRDIARAVDSLDKMEKNPTYKNIGTQKTS